MTELSALSKFKLGLITPQNNPDAYQAFSNNGRRFIHGKHLERKRRSIEHRKSKAIGALKEEGVVDGKPDYSDEEVLPSGITLSHTLVQYAKGDDKVRDQYNQATDDFNVWIQLFTSQLNRFVDKIIVDGEVQVTEGGPTFKKLEGENPDAERYRNNGLLTSPVLSYVNDNAAVLGLGTQYSDTKSITTRDGSLAEEFILGVIETAVSGFSPLAAKQLVGAMTTASGEMKAVSSTKDVHKVYNSYVPMFYYDAVGQRVGCAFNVIRCTFDEHSWKVAIGCSSYTYTNVKVALAVERYNVNLKALHEMVDDSEMIASGKNFFKKNLAAKKAGTLNDPDAKPANRKGAFRIA